MRRTKRVLAILLIIQFLIPSTINALANGYNYEAEAVVLHELGIYAGCNVNYFDPDLGAEVQRQTAVILLVKMFGEKEAADAMTPDEINSILSKYADSNLLAPFACSYMAYAIKSGMVAGTSGRTLGPTTLIDSPSFTCMILKNMGYAVETPNDFIHSLNTLGGLSGMKVENIATLNNKTLIKDDLVGIIYWALKAATVDGGTLISTLILDDVIPLEAAAEQGLIEYDPSTGAPSFVLPENPEVVTDRDIIYGLIRDAMLKVSLTVVLPINSASDTSDEVFGILNDVLADNPRILYHSWSQYQSHTGLLELYYSKDANTAKSHMSLLQDKAQSIISSIIKPGMTDYQKELAIHDYIINHCTYDLHNSPPPESYSAYGSLCLGVAVCEGYAKATQLLLNAAGIECLTVKGSVVDNNVSQGHAWNIVKVDGQYYHLDTTWDDPVTPDGSNLPIHTYFNLADREILRDHVWDADLYPACSDATYNYYVYNGFIAKGHDAFVAFAVDKLNQGSRFITVKVSDGKNSGFDMQATVTEIMKTTHMHSMKMRPIDLYGTVDLWFE